MGLEFAVVNSACPSTATTQKFESSRMTGAPVAAIFFTSSGVTDGSFANDAQVCIGFTDGTANMGFATTSDDVGALGFTNTWQNGSTTKCIRMLNTVSGAAKAEATFSSWSNTGSNYGVTISWSSVTGNQELVTAVLIGDGAAGDLAADVFYIAGNSGVNTETTKTGLAYSPIAIFGCKNLTYDSVLSHLVAGFGMCDAALNQVGVEWFEDDNAAVGVPEAFISNTYMLPKNSAFSTDHEITAITSDGFTITNRNGSAVPNAVFLTIGGGSYATEVQGRSVPTSTGEETVSLTEVANPIGAFTICTQAAAFGTAESDADAGVLSVGAWEETNDWSTQWNIEDANTTPNTASKTQSTQITQHKDDRSSVEYTGIAPTTANLFDADAWSLNWTSVSGGGQKFGIMLFGDAPATGVTVVNTGGATITSKRVLTGVS